MSFTKYDDNAARLRAGFMAQAEDWANNRAVEEKLNPKDSSDFDIIETWTYQEYERLCELAGIDPYEN